MARTRSGKFDNSTPKKTSVGSGPNRKYGSKGGGPGGTTKSKSYAKSYRGQGK